MNLVNCYVEEVKRHLPPALREDTSRELAGRLEEDLQLRRREQGRELNDDEVVQLLREKGHPYKVASAYRAGHTLVSALSYPLYQRTLAFVLSIYLLADVALALFHINQSSGTWSITLIPGFLHSVADTLLFGFFCITVIFHYFGDALAANAFFWHWDPRKLPAFSAAWANAPLGNTFLSIISFVSFLALLTAGRYGFANQNYTLQLDDKVAGYMLALRILVTLSLAVYVVNLFQRHWTRLKLYLVTGAGAVVAVLLLRIAFVHQILHIIVHLPGAPGNEARANRWADWWPNVNVHIFCVVIAAILLYRCARYFTRALKTQVPAI